MRFVIVSVLGYITVIAVVGIAAWAWVETRSLWSFLLILPVIGGFRVQSGG